MEKVEDELGLKIHKLMDKYNISGDIAPDESIEDFWKRKILELEKKLTKKRSVSE